MPTSPSDRLLAHLGALGIATETVDHPPLHTVEESAPARQHGDANVLVLGADVTDPAAAEAILKVFLETAALGERYAARRERLGRLDVSRL